MLPFGLVCLVFPGSKMHGCGFLCNRLPLAALYFFTLKAFSHSKETRWLTSIVVFFLSFFLFFNNCQDDVKWSQLRGSCSADFICIGILGCVVENTLFEVWELAGAAVYFRRDMKGGKKKKELEERKKKRKNKLKQHGVTRGEILPRWSQCQNPQPSLAPSFHVCSLILILTPLVCWKLTNGNRFDIVHLES